MIWDEWLGIYLPGGATDVRIRIYIYVHIYYNIPPGFQIPNPLSIYSIYIIYMQWYE